MQTTFLWCCGCKMAVDARLTSGEEIYPHRPDLYHLPFWKCDLCQNYIGCHHKTNNPTKPVGSCIPTPELRSARVYIHIKLDPLWKSGRYTRRNLYRLISKKLGKEFHTSNICSIEEARKVSSILQSLAATGTNRSALTEAGVK